MDDAVDNDDDADDFVEVDVVVEGQISRQLQRPHQRHAVSEGHKKVIVVKVTTDM